MNHAKHILTASILSLTLIAPAAVAAPVEVSFTGSSIDFATKAAGMGYQLTVTGPDAFLAVETFKDGALPYFHAAGLADGYYKYELTALLDQPAGDDRAVSLKAGPLAAGTVLVQNGSLIDPTRAESFLKDQVILDDLIVDGSACIGLDCVNGESFGFDTLRLKENNLRIRFQDTSTTASFASNDWQITANETENGGLNKFSIDDIDGGRTPFTLEAGAPSHSLYVDDGGRLGLGTSTPVVDAHIVSGNTPTLRLEQNGSSGFTPQTWDLAGNESNFFIRDVTNGSRLSFRIRPGAPESSIDIASDGDVGVGTGSPDGRMHILETAASNTTLRVENNNATASNTEVRLVNTAREWLFRNNTSGDFVINVPGDVGFEFSLDQDGNLAAQGTVEVGNTNTGLNPGTAACIDSLGRLCACDSCS